MEGIFTLDNDVLDKDGPVGDARVVGHIEAAIRNELKLDIPIKFSELYHFNGKSLGGLVIVSKEPAELKFSWVEGLLRALLRYLALLFDPLISVLSHLSLYLRVRLNLRVFRFGGSFLMVVDFFIRLGSFLPVVLQIEMASRRFLRVATVLLFLGSAGIVRLVATSELLDLRLRLREVFGKGLLLGPAGSGLGTSFVSL